MSEDYVQQKVSNVIASEAWQSSFLGIDAHRGVIIKNPF